MEVKLIIFEVYPPVSEIVRANEGLIITLLTDQCERFINVGDSLANPKGSLFKSTEKAVKFGLFRGTEYLGIGELHINNDVKWVTVHNEAASSNTNTNNISVNVKSNNSSHNPLAAIRLRVKCCPVPSSNKSYHISTNSKAQFTSYGESRKNKKPVVRINSHNNGTVPLPLPLQIHSLDRRNISSVTVGKLPIDTKMSYDRPLLTKSFQNKSTENHFNVLNTEMYFNSSTKKSLHSNRKKKSGDFTQTAKSISIIPTPSMISTRTDYKTNFTHSKIKSYDYTNSLPNKTTLEDQIIDQSFENNIKKDEMIGERITEASIDENGLKNIDEDYLALNEAFDACKNDFFILYDDNYLNEIPIENMHLETELYIEKVSELQLKYHEAIKEMNRYFNYYNKKAEKYNNNILKLIKMKSQLALASQQFDYVVNTNNNVKTKLENLILNKEELKFWNKAVIQVNSLSSNETQPKAKSNVKESLIEVIKAIFSDMNPQKESIFKAKANILNPLQHYFLGKILDNANKKQTKLIKINRSEEVTLTIENLKNNLKSKMLPMLSSPNDNKTDINNTQGNYYNNDTSFNPQSYQRILSQESLEVTKTSNNKSSYNLVKGIPMTLASTKHKQKKSEFDLTNYRSKSKPYFKLFR